MAELQQTHYWFI